MPARREGRSLRGNGSERYSIPNPDGKFKGNQKTLPLVIGIVGVAAGGNRVLPVQRGDKGDVAVVEGLRGDGLRPCVVRVPGGEVYAGIPQQVFVEVAPCHAAVALFVRSLHVLLQQEQDAQQRLQRFLHLKDLPYVSGYIIIWKKKECQERGRRENGIYKKRRNG